MLGGENTIRCWFNAVLGITLWLCGLIVVGRL